jgi:o-succinylbenzoate---CoA ligase
MSHILCPIKEGAKRHPGLTAIYEGSKRVSYQELDLLVERAQQNLTGSRIAIYHAADVRVIALLFAALRLNIQIFVANTRSPFEFIQQKAKELGISCLITSSNIESFFFPGEKKQSAEISLETSSFFLLTSGTTGAPKIASLSVGNFYHSALSVSDAVSLEENDNWLLCLPLFHVGGIGVLFRVFFRGASLTLPVKNEEALSSPRITHISYVPTQLYRLLQNPFRPKKLKCLLIGGAATATELYKKAAQAGYPIHLTYGLTEMSSSVLIEKNPVIEENLLYLGQPLPCSEIKLKNSEIFVRGNSLFKGYVGMPQPQDWFGTKDLGIYKEGAGFAVIGRKDRLFISGGENIQPEEIERAILQNPFITEAYVVPRLDPEFGSVPVLFYRSIQEFSEDYLQSYLKERLGSYKTPREYVLLDEEFFKPDLQKMTQIANLIKGEKT